MSVIGLSIEGVYIKGGSITRVFIIRMSIGGCIYKRESLLYGVFIIGVFIIGGVYNRCVFYRGCLL